jgi:hypothetical protein
MLALVALLTGGFLVYSAQSLSVMRRLGQFALLRTLGLRKGSVEAQLLAEGLALGLVGSTLGLLLGYGIAALALRFVGGDLGGGYFGGTSSVLSFSPGCRDPVPAARHRHGYWRQLGTGAARGAACAGGGAEERGRPRRSPTALPCARPC